MQKKIERRRQEEAEEEAEEEAGAAVPLLPHKRLEASDSCDQRRRARSKEQNTARILFKQKRPLPFSGSP